MDVEHRYHSIITILCLSLETWHACEEAKARVIAYASPILMKWVAYIELFTYVAYSSSGGYRAAMISVVSRTIMNKIGCRVN